MIEAEKDNYKIAWMCRLLDVADQLQAWHDNGQRGERPPGRLRPYARPTMSRATRTWAGPLYRALADPDGRPPRLRRSHSF